LYLETDTVGQSQRLPAIDFTNIEQRDSYVTSPLLGDQKAFPNKREGLQRQCTYRMGKTRSLGEEPKTFRVLIGMQTNQFPNQSLPRKGVQYWNRL